MAHLPSFEEILSEVHIRLGLEALKNPNRFKSYKMEAAGHVQRVQRLLEDIFEALELDKRACQDATQNITALGHILKIVELKTWTGNASQQQVLWYTLAWIHVPVLARDIAFWSLHNIERELPPIDAGMPGGQFWFLPSNNWDSGKVEMPMAKVFGWLMDLLDQSSLEKAAELLAGDPFAKTDTEDTLDPASLARKLRYWCSGNVPKCWTEVEDLFSDALDFPGAFVLDSGKSSDEQFENARKFVVDRKILGNEPAAVQFARQIPMSVERLLPIFDGSASDKEQGEFVRLVTIRFGKPEVSTIRQRLRVARLAQAGYKDLVSYLCPDLSSEQERDPRYNKVLQLISLFETIYNKTIQAWHYGNNAAEQDAWFEAQFPPLSFYDRLLAIQPSLDWQKRADLLAERLTRRFLKLEPEDRLENFVAANEGDLLATFEPWINHIQLEIAEDQCVESLREKVWTGSPKRAMQVENSYWVLSQFVHSERLTDWIRECALERMKVLAGSPLERGSVRLLELGFLLNVETCLRPKDAYQKVLELLNAAQADNEAWQLWKAPMLRFRAKHALFENRLKDAEVDFKAALEACSERAFGGLRGEIARDGFATAVVATAFNPGNHELYYRNMLLFMEFPNGFPSFEDAATECEEFFWSTLYQPYPGVEPFEGKALGNAKMLLKSTFGLIAAADWRKLRKWMEGNKSLFKDHIKDVRHSSVLLAWLKLLQALECGLPSMKAMLPSEFYREFVKFDSDLKNWHEAIRLLLEVWPKQALIADFKKQTPLMLVADHGDADLTCLLAPLSDINAQDYLGRTALHSAVTGRSAECLAAVLEMNPDVLKVSEGEENTALHTAVRFGWPEGVRLILEVFPGLSAKANAEGFTPLEMGQDILQNFEQWSVCMHMKQSRRIGTQNDFEKTITLLDECAIH